MADRAPVARSLMHTQCARIGLDATLREAMRQLVGLQQDPKQPTALIVVDDAGRYAGLLTARLLFRSLLNLWSPARSVRSDDTLLDRDLLAVVAGRAHLGVADALVHGLPTAGPDAGLLTLIDLICDERLDYLPVVDDERNALGLVPVTAIFETAAALALTPEDRGIQMDG